MFAKIMILVHLHTVTLTLKFKVTFGFSWGDFICQNQLSTSNIFDIKNKCICTNITFTLYG